MHSYRVTSLLYVYIYIYIYVCVCVCLMFVVYIRKQMTLNAMYCSESTDCFAAWNIYHNPNRINSVYKYCYRLRLMNQCVMPSELFSSTYYHTPVLLGTVSKPFPLYHGIYWCLSSYHIILENMQISSLFQTPLAPAGCSKVCCFLFLVHRNQREFQSSADAPLQHARIIQESMWHEQAAMSSFWSHKYTPEPDAFIKIGWHTFYSIPNNGDLLCDLVHHQHNGWQTTTSVGFIGSSNSPVSQLFFPSGEQSQQRI